MKLKHATLASAALVMAIPAMADPVRDVQYGSVPAWVIAAPTNATEVKPNEAAFRLIYQDMQQRVIDGTLEQYSAYRVKILKPEALALGNISVLWSPSAGSATVHFVRVIREGATIDILKQAKLKTIERETGLEQSILDGNLTANLQVSDLRVGDELEFATTIVSREGAFGAHNAGIALIPSGGVPGVYRYRLLWPAGKSLSTRVSADLPAATMKTQGGFKTLSVEMRDPAMIPDLEGAPARYSVHRVIEYSDYSGWQDLSRQMWPLFDKASRLEPGSPLRAEAAKIAAASSDPAMRAEAALRLVQDQVRYVFVGLNGGNYIPLSADETWKRRFGDCKAKTALLIALLRELGITGEPMLVNSKGGDGTDARLPNPQLFDHVLVRTRIAGREFWLDGTRLGDRHLDMSETPDVYWALPLSARGSDLAHVSPNPSRYPQTIDIVDIDATAGFGREGIWTIKQVVHGDQAFGMNTSLASMSQADAQRTLKAFFRQSMNEIDPHEVSWRYDERHATIVLAMKGKGKVDWEGDDSNGHSLTLPGAGFNPPAKMERPKDQDQSAPWYITFPKFRCYSTTVHLPPPTKGFHWGYRSKPVDRHLAGAAYWRQAGLEGNVVRTIMSSNALTRELSAEGASQSNAQIPTFDNFMSTVDELAGARDTKPSPLPFKTEPDWVVNPAVCSAASK